MMNNNNLSLDEKQNDNDENKNERGNKENVQIEKKKIQTMQKQEQQTTANLQNNQKKDKLYTSEEDEKIVVGFKTYIDNLKFWQETKQIDLRYRSPVFTFFNQTTQGVLPIKIYQKQELFSQNFDYILNNSLRTSFTYWNNSRAFGYYVNLVTTIASIIGVFMLLAINQDPSTLGQTIIYFLSISDNIQWGLRQMIQTDVSMSSAYRAMNKTLIESEPALRTEYDSNKILQNRKIKESFPTKGVVEFNNIDGHNINDLGLHTLRGGISIIPQVPFIFSGTIRRNLDPLNLFSDEQIIATLQDINLKEKVTSLPNGINTDMTNSAEIFSTGQKQLICLGRAQLRQSKIIVLDEATANCDMQTDELIQSKIREKFSNSTVITVSHRLNTIADYDKIVVMDKGVAIESGKPYDL
ncbi:ABC transporter C family protein (macronuclear) [Tetrahymena thermophila SB210]|uniref:ABC transporter C family protein n=1 Tax=Tetrahymena thermophila (strain SB210) TaxID=312017 RepID=Q23TS5_TETTS|nr:ABC transporter C family protein [Tetrahymena thermophila SB210]EAR99970.2 ABC transporter C family protein [Tetrahymena thermophila SB210]|eukprot:XP_001020215.2 ABC transporter C family protein [Tetrahymena thermophila SB210]